MQLGSRFKGTGLILATKIYLKGFFTDLHGGGGVGLKQLNNPISMHTNLSSKSWYTRATVARVPYTKVLSLLNGTVQTMHL